MNFTGQGTCACTRKLQLLYCFLVLKVTSLFLWFLLSTLRNWLKKTVLLSQPTKRQKKKKKNNQDLLFPVLDVISIYLLRVLIGFLRCFRPF